MMSPAATVNTFEVSCRSCARKRFIQVARYSTPPAGLPLMRPLPPVGGSMLPWKSLKAMRCALAVGVCLSVPGNVYDTADIGGKTFNFDGDWKKAKITADDYTKTYSTTDEQYTQMIQVLLAGLKKSS